VGDEGWQVTTDEERVKKKIWFQLTTFCECCCHASRNSQLLIYSFINTTFYASAAYMRQQRHNDFLVRRGLCLSRLPSSAEYVFRFAGILNRFQWNSPEVIRQITWLHFGRNWNRTKRAGYARIVESMSVGFAAMSNRWMNSQISHARQIRSRTQFSL